MSAGKPKIMVIDLGKLFIDPRYQRPVDEKRVKKIRNTFNWAQFGVLEISARDGARYAIFDGQHRYEAAVLLGLDEVPCLVHTGLTPKDESTLFTLLQSERRGLSHLDRFRAEDFAGKKRAVEISETLSDLGYVMGKQKKDGEQNRISAVIQLEAIYEKYGIDHLRRTLAEIRDLWSGDEGALQGKFIFGFAHFLASYGDDRYDQEIKNKLSAVAPLVIIRRAAVVHAGDARPGLAVFAAIRKVSGVRGRPRKFSKKFGWALESAID